MNVLACVGTVFMSCSVVILASFVNNVIKEEVKIAIKLGSTHHVFLKCPVPS